MPVKDLKEWFSNLSLTEHQQQIGKRILLEINQRLQTLIDVAWDILL